jgi:electron transfer flavoprotein alpha/beta subunit
MSWQTLLWIGLVAALVGWRLWASVRRRERNGEDLESRREIERYRYYKDH